MICAGCGTENRSSRRFCLRCGRALAATCDGCGAPNEPEAAFCGECGLRLGAGGGGTGERPPAAGAAPAHVAERRLVSVLFADLVGFTPYAEERDVEVVREALSRYFELAAGVIANHGGTVEKFIGDAVMAIWGAPTAHEDDAERAVRAALELVEAVAVIDPSITARAAVVTGEAAVSLGAAGQGMVAGDLVNTASRLQALAPAGAVVVGEATMRAASRAIVFEPAGEHLLKGKAVPVAAWRAGPVVAERGGRGRRQNLEPPFVGRADELRALKEALHATGRDARPRLVSITGVAGIGKSRLLWELEKYVEGLVEPIFWHAGRSPAHGDGVSAWALGEMIRQRAGLVEADDPGTTRLALDALVAEWVPDPDDRRWVEPALLTLLGLEPPPPDGRDALYAGWRILFEKIAARGTTVLAFEDLQWADDGLLDFIEHLLGSPRGSPILVVTLARPELLDRRAGWGAGIRGATSLPLEPLQPAEMRDLIRGLVPALSEQPLASIVDRAAGVPLYAVETIRMLIVEGKLEPANGAWRPTVDLDELAVPETLRSLVAARLDALDPVDRRLLEDAAVLGGAFSPDALMAVSGTALAELEPRLRGLVRRELISLDVDPRSPGRGQYAFLQGLVREVAYATLSRRDRRDRHLAAARYLESLGADELASVLAAHYVAAHRSADSGPERDALAVQARLTLRGAASRAAAVGAHDQAVDFVEQALALEPDPVQEAALLELAGTAALSAGRYALADTYVRRAIAIHRQRGDRPAVARATAALGETLMGASRAAAARDVLEPAAAELADLVDAPERVALAGQLARMHFLVDEFDRSIEVADHVLADAERLDLVRVVADTLVTKGSALSMVGRGYEGSGAIEAGLRLAEANGFDGVALRARTNRSAFLANDDPVAAYEASRENLALARRLGDRGVSVIIQNLADSGLRTGRWDELLAELSASLDEDLDPSERAWLLGNELAIRAIRGEPITQMHAEVVALLEGITDPAAYAWRAWCDAWEAFPAGRYAETRTRCLDAIRVFAQAADVAGILTARAALWGRDIDGAAADLARLQASGARGRAARADRLTVRAGIAALGGRRAEALATYREVLRAWRDLGCAWDEALTAIDMALLLDPAEPEVRAAAERARDILVGLRARPFLERLDAALAVVTPAAGARSARAPAERPTSGFARAPER